MTGCTLRVLTDCMPLSDKSREKWTWLQRFDDLTKKRKRGGLASHAMLVLKKNADHRTMLQIIFLSSRVTFHALFTN